MVDPTKKINQTTSLKRGNGSWDAIKIPLFLSIYKQHKIQARTKDQIFFMDFLGTQHTKASLKETGMAQARPKREKNMFQRPVATVQ